MHARIYTLRGIKIILERDLAALYGEDEQVLKAIVEQNNESFSEDSVFKLSPREWDEISALRHTRDSLEEPEIHIPHAFTELGIVMMANFLNTPNARKLCVDMARVFIAIREDRPVMDLQTMAMQRLRNELAGMIKHDEQSRQLYSVINTMLDHKFEVRQALAREE